MYPLTDRKATVAEAVLILHILCAHIALHSKLFEWKLGELLKISSPTRILGCSTDCNALSCPSPTIVRRDNFSTVCVECQMAEKLLFQVAA